MPYSRVAFRITFSDIEWHEIFNDTKHRAVSLQQLLVINWYTATRSADIVTKWVRVTIAVWRSVRVNETSCQCQYTKVKVKVWTLAIALLTWVRLVTSSTLPSRKWQLIGMSQWCRSALCGHPLPVLTDNWTHGAASRHLLHRPNQPH